ncbi:hypothetical protein EON65_57745 [archaeon]|nr:MAG: hypothetical protein EON65_57745 [archaeon]
MYLSPHPGVVVVRCAGCSNMHLIADHLGIFEEPGWDINEFLKTQAEQGVRHITEDNVVELGWNDIVGRKKGDDELEKV